MSLPAPALPGDVVREFPDTRWDDAGPTRHVEDVVESGHVLSFPRLPFPLSAADTRFLDERFADGKAKNISVRWPAGELRGAQGSEAEQAELKALITRYAETAEAFALRLFPHYAGHLKRGNTSLRPAQIAGRETSWRQDDTRLHIDAFPSNPMQGTRLLRVFCNVNPNGEPREWRVGESFEAHAKRFLPQAGSPLPGSAWLLESLHITKRRRTEYDHLMLRLHDLSKADLDYQREGPQARVDFAPGTTWVVFSDQVLHGVLRGQHMFEQTFYLEVQDQADPARSPLGVLERLTGRTLR